VSQFVKQASIYRKLQSVTDVIESVEIGQRKANENNELRKNRNLVKLYCLKLNPEIICKDPKKKLILTDIPALVIPNLKSYYNLHINDKNEVKTSILANSGKSFDLFVEPYLGKEAPNIKSLMKFKGETLIKDKYLNIQNNLGNKEIFFNTISKRKTAFATNSLNSTPNSSQDSPRKKQNQSNHFFNNSLPVPHRCQERIEISKNNNRENPHLEYCTVEVKYSLNQIQTLSQIAVNNELYNHGHAMSLIVRRNKQRDVEQGREELSMHYKKYHTGSKVSISEANTSKVLA